MASVSVNRSLSSTVMTGPSARVMTFDKPQISHEARAAGATPPRTWIITSFHSILQTFVYFFNLILISYCFGSR